MALATLLLPERTRLPGALPADVARALGRADAQHGQPGEDAQLRRHFQLVPDHWQVAALTRQRDAGDAAGHAWLRADPAYIAPDMNGARLLAHGEALALDQAEAAEFVRLLRPLFGDAGFMLDAPHPARWYLRIKPGTPLPEFASPHDALGDDLFPYLPAGEPGRQWRALFTEAQILLHQHPANAARARAGKAPVNGIWFWGAGTLPSVVRTPHRQVRSREELLLALAHVAGVAAEDAAGEVDALVDLRHLSSVDLLGNDAVRPLLTELQTGALQAIVLDFRDGLSLRLDRRQRWRFWKRPLAGLGSL